MTDKLKRGCLVMDKIFEDQTMTIFKYRNMDRWEIWGHERHRTAGPRDEDWGLTAWLVKSPERLAFRAAQLRDMK